jgi:L-2-hydroxyglutarate oxidase
VIYDFCVVGGGIVGLSTALQLAQRFAGATIALVEKENAIARHQTGRNSGVIHAGVYYAPGSLKARYCREGSRATKAFCDAHRIPYDTCGKLLVATGEAEMTGMAELEARAHDNGLQMERLDARALHKREPNIRGLGALWVPSTAIVDYRAVSEAMAGDLRTLGGDVRFGWKVLRLEESGDRVAIVANTGTLVARHVIGCAGVHADQLARASGLAIDFQIVPFRGDYYRLPASRNGIVKHLIYPIPDPALPFLGIHLTRMIDGSVTVGPNAALALAREGYSRLAFDWRDTLDMLRFSGFRKAIWKYRGHAAAEATSAFSRRRYLAMCRKYCPALTLADLQPHPSGIRAQAVLADGTLVHDFLIRESARTVHVCNAPSPAATAAIPIGKHLVDLVAAKAGIRQPRPHGVAA